MARLRPFNNNFDGAFGKVLAGLLNGFKPRYSKQYARCVRLIREFDLIASGKPIPHNLFRNPNEREEFLSRKIRTAYVVNGETILATDPRDVPGLAIMRLNGRLEKYRAYPVVNFELKGRRKGSCTVKWESPSHEGTIAYLIVRLAESGLLWRVRECNHCSDWYFANRSNKKFCKPACSKLYWQTGGAGRERRRPYMKEYMRKVRKEEREQRSKGARHVHL